MAPLLDFGAQYTEREGGVVDAPRAMLHIELSKVGPFYWG